MYPHGRALRGIADRLLKVLVAMLTSGSLYDPSLRSAPEGDRRRRPARSPEPRRPRRRHPPPHRPRPRRADARSEGQESARSRPEPQGAREPGTPGVQRSDRGEDGEHATLPEASTSACFALDGPAANSS